MVELDYLLLHQARHWITGANIHRMNELIFVYEQSVNLHNRQIPGYEIYRRKHEMDLRSYVVDCRMVELDRRMFAAQKNASLLTKQSRRLHQKSEELNSQIAALEKPITRKGR